ncbi:MAG: hypothetical protein DI539_13880 [Flavobacterium psychrophilum]|nr:MAG: hypothetical protein DI539_13880 [Flavobacterium psychrophilum]
MEDITPNEYLSFFKQEQIQAYNPSNKYIKKRLKEIGIKQFLIRKHIHVIINKNDKLTFIEQDEFHAHIKQALQKNERIIYVLAFK